MAGVRSRVSVPAILAGAMTALALSFLLALLGGAVGLSMRDAADGRTSGWGRPCTPFSPPPSACSPAGVVASQLTAGENKREAALYGAFVWAAVMTAFLFLAAGGVKAGFGAMVGLTTAGGTVADAAARNMSEGDVDAMLRRAKYTQPQIDEFKEKVKNAPADAGAKADDPATQQKVEQAAREAANVATRVAWSTFAGAVLSLLAAVAGGFFGGGPTFRLFAARAVVTGRPRR